MRTYCFQSCIYQRLSHSLYFLFYYAEMLRNNVQTKAKITELFNRWVSNTIREYESYLNKL